jgi:hypothetical protein
MKPFPLWSQVQANLFAVVATGKKNQGKAPGKYTKGWLAQNFVDHRAKIILSDP